LIKEIGKLDWEQNNFIEIINNIKNIINEIGKNSGVIASNLLSNISVSSKLKDGFIFIPILIFSNFEKCSPSLNSSTYSSKSSSR